MGASTFIGFIISALTRLKPNRKVFTNAGVTYLVYSAVAS